MTSLAIARVAPSDFGGDPSTQRLEGGVDLEDASYFMCLTACACLHGAFSIFFLPALLHMCPSSFSLSVVCTSGGLIPAVYRGGFVRREIVGRVPR